MESAAEVRVLGARLLMVYVNARDVNSFADMAHVYGLPSDERYAAKGCLKRL